MRRGSLIWRNLWRHRTHSLFASVGIVVGVAMLLFFGALSAGVERNVVARIIPERQVEVVPRSVQLGAFQRQGGLFGGSASGLSDYTVADLRAIPGVVGVYPRLQIGFPALARGGASLLGESMYAELLADGIPPDLLGESFGRDAAGALAFTDWEALTSCVLSEACAPDHDCVDGRCVGRSCVPEDEVWWAPSRLALSRATSVARSLVPSSSRLSSRAFSSEDGAQGFALVVEDGAARQLLREELRARDLTGEVPSSVGCGEGPTYCHRSRRTCEMPVPVLASPTMLELYNGNLQSMMAGAAGGSRPPRLTEDALIGLRFEATLGRGMLGTSRGVREGRAELEDVELQVVGFSPLALPIGATLPLPYISRWNARYGESESSGSWSSILVEVARAKDLNPAVDTMEGSLGLAVHDRFESARRVAGLVSIITWVLAGIGGVMIGVAAVNIAHTFMMLVTERRREIGILRSLGATRLDVTTLLLGEASLIGVFGWALAYLASRLAALVVDYALAHWVGEFPWKPSTLFHFSPWFVALSLGIALVCATIGALLPSSRAARMDPADALREHE